MRLQDQVNGSDQGLTERDLSAYVATFRRRWRWLTLPLVVVLAAAAYSTLRQAPTYRATASVLIRSSFAEGAVRGTNTNPALLSRELFNEINFATSDDVEGLVVSELGVLPTVSVNGDKNADVLNFSATAGSPDAAAHVANTWAEAYVAQKQADALASVTGASQQLSQRLEALKVEREAVRTPHDDLRQQLAGTNDANERILLEAQLERASTALAAELALILAQEQAAATAIANLELEGQLARTESGRIANRAEAPTERSDPSLTRNLALALVLGTILGAALALLRDALDKAVKNADDVERCAGVPVLASVPFDRWQRKDGDLGLATVSDPTSAVADAYHTLRTGLQFAMLGREINSILMTSPNQGEGKTVSSTNLAWALATVIPRIVLIDGDFRRPRVHDVYGVPNAAGFSDHVLSGQRIDEVSLHVELEDAHLTVIPTGPLPPNPADFVSSRPFALAVNGVARDADLVVIDGPPVLPVSDALTLARTVDAVIVVARAGETTTDELRAALGSLQQVGADVLGVVLVGVKEHDRYGRYGYYGNDSEIEQGLRSKRPRVTRTADPSVKSPLKTPHPGRHVVPPPVAQTRR